ncbi:sensor histidine kinase [Streptomyces bluensis]|uniref:sensor histidine kinase n=1 Tax=Streptomyces bluensis TaxID=33897 RepID=UPI00331C1CD7
MQGRFKRDGSASAEPEPHGGTGPMKGSSAPQHAQNPGPAQTGDGGERTGRTGASAPPPPAARSKSGPSGPGSRIALRNWRISTRLVSLLALPVVAATSLGALRISDNVDDIQQLDNMRLLTDMTKQATELAAALQQERDISAGPLSAGGSATDPTIKGVRDKTDTAQRQFLRATQQIDDASSAGQLTGVRDSLVGIATELGQLTNIRRDAYQDGENATLTVEAYHRLISRLLNLSQDMAEATSNQEMISRTRALAAFSTAKEYASVQRAIIAAALPGDNKNFGDLSESDRQYGLSALTSEGSETDSFGNIYGRDRAEELMKPISDGSPTIKAVDEYAKRVLDNRNGLRSLDKRSYRDWIDDDSVKIEQMKKIEGSLLEEMEQTARQLRSESEREAIISGALILLVLGISLVGAFVVARSMIRSLRRLQDTATKVAQDRLPELVKQLSESDPQDVDTSVETVGLHSKDEIGQVAAAFDDVHREAVRLAAEQALLRGNVNAMFTNLSRRSQGLIQRQLSLISELESREADPDQLSSLFKLDHLATRMRRNGENLLVLAGEEPGRRWTRPVPLVDVLRAAASEVEQYERIELAAVPSTEVAGRVVNDLVHLLAELLENATSFSSPQTKVKVTGHALPDGRVLIEIHDTGIGLSPEDLAAINERLASPPTVDVSVSRRMGLFVVGRLSQRHGIRIQLRPSDSGGTTALVMLPVDVAQGGKKPTPGKPGQPGIASGGPAAAQASAGAAAARRGNQPGAGTPGGRLGAVPQRGQVGAGQGPRAALPGSDQDSRPGGPGGPRGPQGAPPAPAGAGAGGFFGGQAPGAPQGLQAAGTGGPQNFFDDSSGRQGGFAGGGSGLRPPGGPLGDNGFSASRQGGFGEGGPSAERGSGAVPPPQQQQPKERSGRRRPQLPGRGGPRAELPGGNPQPRTPSWSDENAQPPVPRASLDAPRGHEEPDTASGAFSTDRMPRFDDRQGPGSTEEMPRIDDREGPAVTSEFQRPDFDAPRPDLPQNGTGQFVRSDVFGGAGPSAAGDRYPAPERGNPQDTGQFTAPGYHDAGTGRFEAPGYGDHQDPSSTGQFERPQMGGGADFGAPRPAMQQRPPVPPQRQQEPEALPPAPNPGDGRTPLYEALETNWFHGGPPSRPGNGNAPSTGNGPGNGSGPGNGATPSQSPAADRRPAGPAGLGGSGSPADSGWRATPNDELVRQAERVRQPSAGGVTTSGLPRRVPRANLVPGTAQQQQHQSGPQVSRAPDDVRGRLTNLRRGIAQGRQAGTGQTGSFPSPTHQQER